MRPRDQCQYALRLCLAAIRRQKVDPQSQSSWCWEASGKSEPLSIHGTVAGRLPRSETLRSRSPTASPCARPPAQQNVQEKKGLIISDNVCNLLFSFSAHSGVAGTLTGGHVRERHHQCSRPWHESKPSERSDESLVLPSMPTGCRCFERHPSPAILFRTAGERPTLSKALAVATGSPPQMRRGGAEATGWC